MNSKERFLAAVKNQETDRPPVWLMRQAGRYLPEYRAIKAKHPTKEMMQTPEIARDITVQPVDILGVDAAILYSDILMIPDALGMGLEFALGEGPKFAFKIDSADALNRLNPNGTMERLSYVFEAAKLCAQKLGPQFPLIGFAGAPYTVATYMVAGSGSKTFGEIKALAYDQPLVYEGLLNLITDLTIDYLKHQVDAGACAVQLFDTWAGQLSRADYEKLALPYSKRIFAALKKAGVPGIHFVKGADHLLDLVTTVESDGIGLDWRTPLAHAEQVYGDRFARQGNFDPDWLFLSPAAISKKFSEMTMGLKNPRKGCIMNLGHGVDQKTPVAHVQHFVNLAKTFG